MLIPGRNPTLEALHSAFRVKRLLLQEDINEDAKIASIVDAAQKHNVKIEYRERRELERLSKGEPHQGVIAELDMVLPNIDDTDLMEENGLYIYIRDAQYEHNLGAILRTAEVAGAKGVIIPPKLDITPVTARVSMGAVFHLPVFQGSLFPTIKYFQENDYQIYGIERGNDTPYFQVKTAENCLLIIGGEDYELSKEVLDKCDDVLSIPQFGKVNSLNMSVAAGLVIYEYVRQHKAG